MYHATDTQPRASRMGHSTMAGWAQRGRRWRAPGTLACTMRGESHARRASSARWSDDYAAGRRGGRGRRQHDATWKQCSDATMQHGNNATMQKWNNPTATMTMACAHRRHVAHMGIHEVGWQRPCCGHSGTRAELPATLAEGRGQRAARRSAGIRVSRRL